MNQQPTLLEINERIPISKQDYLHLLYRLEELERKVARLEQGPEITTTYGNVQAIGTLPAQLTDQGDPFEQLRNPSDEQYQETMRSFQENFERLSNNSDGVTPYTTEEAAEDDALIARIKALREKEEDQFRESPPLTPEQEATYGSISSNTTNNMSAASERASSFIEKFNKQQ